MEVESPHLKMSKNKNPDDFKVKDAEEVPNRYVCYIKIKVFDGEKPIRICHGSGVLLADGWVLTAAHNVKGQLQAIDRIKNLKHNPVVHSYVKLALHNGTNHGEFSIVAIHICSKYTSITTNIHDYALLQIAPKVPEEYIPEPFYPAVVAFSNAALAKVQKVSVYGYSIPVNKMNSADQDQSSIYVKNLYGAKGGIKDANDFKLSYTASTDYGVSGGPVFIKYAQEYVVIAIHKASTFLEQINLKQDPNTVYQNFGVNAFQILEEVNEWGYEFRKRPFVFTERTIALRKNEEKIGEMEILYLGDRGLQFQDIQVVTAYDLTNLKKIILSGNNLEEKGVACLTRRPLPALRSLFLPQNNIRSLQALSDDNWRNISGLTLLVLSVNKLSVFPQKVRLLEQLEDLWLSYNQLREIEATLIDYCQTLKHKLNIFLYDNKIKEEIAANKEKKAILDKTQAHIIWTRQQKAEENL